ncbi:phage tail assembly protein [Hyphomicrobium sulfonivorans]|uniref:phage tail assembly protein n=1 Tax=Hyphomicrobium sulfonivorans TaxID=121290 RepID=UPI00156FF9AB|nr:phage tail assembly protein [Hyphomicrobium sulfonivorans]MBI1649884.1 phage tail assembly protein [Hyphomicrobium sulfonivorans]NSL71795.1 hypothetical protein [Hyphomicrobium sulfonivorans]
MSEENKDPAKPMSRGLYPLRHPFQRSDGTEVTELILRRARAKDVLAIERVGKRKGTDTEATLAFLASTNGMTEDEIAEIDAEDLIAISEKVIDFLPDDWKAARKA